MTDRIEPALTATQWASVYAVKRAGILQDTLLTLDTADLGLAGLIAAANAALPDSDPRKITRAMVEEIREAAASHAAYDSLPQFAALAARVQRIADALSSYLPPEGPV